MALSFHVTPPAHVALPAALEDAAMHFAVLDPLEAEATIDAFVSGAIAAWRLDDATYWQRVKLRARLLRTMRRIKSNGARGSDIFTTLCETGDDHDEPCRS